MKHAIVLAFSAPLLLGGCSTYSGNKLGLDNDGHVVAPVGVPYQLVRPTYSINFAPPATGEGDPTYTISLGYEPDPSQRYSLRMDPGYFTNPDFTMTFGAGAALASTKLVTTETLTASIKALGTTASSLAAFGVFDEGSKLEANLAGRSTAQSAPALLASGSSIGTPWRRRLKTFRSR